MEEIKITSVLTTIALILIGVLLFELIIFIHEFGHFITAKKSGIKVNEFSLGMGPKIFSFGKGETKYSLRVFPIGGFCAMEGEDEESPEPRAFNNAKVWKRMIVIIAGAVMNIILGFVLMFVVVVQQDAYSSTEVQSFPATSFSSCTGLQSGDVIKEINGYGISTSMDFNYPISTAELKTVDGSTLEIYKEDCGNNLYNMAVSLVQDKNNKLSDEQVSKVNELLSKSTSEIVKAKSKEDAYSVYENYYKEINDACGIKDYKVEKIVEKETRKRYTADILVERNGEEKLLKNVQFFTYTTKDNSDPQVSIDFYVKPIEKTFGSVLSQTFKQTISTCKMIYASLGGLLTGKFGLKDMSGPIGIASAVTTVASESLSSGFMSAVNSIIYVMMIITVNLGLFNMLPFPALDGGRFVFLIIEAIRGKSVPRKVEAIVNGIGMGLLILLMILITANDIFKLIW
ncbi:MULTISPECIES: RIP metalloprotease RseP [Ruminococcus]|uniref:RIP metalloprotease RseP n=1 Tax=Ruminococcus TaxID=1263 RepID=UPI001E532ACC|nr:MULTISPECIES: RIP metalloprotease RseP [Ruminococcus]MEE3438415.1 RIP metalloprotease RseP [Ruminococcus sp.]